VTSPRARRCAPSVLADLTRTRLRAVRRHGVNTHAITHMKEGLGYTIEAASFVIMLQTMPSSAAWGWGLDRRPLRQGHPLCALHAGPHERAAFPHLRHGPAMIVAYAILHGTAWGLRGPLLHAIRADYFGRSAIGIILGLSFMITVIGQIGGPMIAGILADMTATTAPDSPRSPSCGLGRHSSACEAAARPMRAVT